HDGRFSRTLLRQDNVPNRSIAREDGNRQRALDRAHTAVERKLTDADDVNKTVVLGKIAVGAKDAERDRQVETRTFLAHVGGREIDRGLLKRKEVTAVLHRGPN